jgi:hypothetical protein
MTVTSKLSLLEIVNKITALNQEFLTKLGEVVKLNGQENLTEEQEKYLVDACAKLNQASSKILESCK